MTDDESRMMGNARELFDRLREETRDELVMELGMHASAGPRACLCGGWHGEGSYSEHLADSMLAVVFPTDP